ncbi:DUF6062 family protein [Anaeromassilibacillus sp. An200]|uniref:DUF6062 family protein n=1 Tax=Anaeromassilibacillus sp. An200 TaxID=1965587 RepID=UPI000B3AC660|nr:DUF6062 family protein [Anaeromassilibacillus sp. An200]OUP14030.1 hypothetical protein B5F35_01605 [Anaeromassilibacillus sp. An200]
MREDICSIPISELFEPKKGCPICRMDAMLESRLAEYITGAAMMEPDVRIETNRLGFCSHHFDRICEVGSRLSIALILESHLKEVEERAFSAKAAPKKKKLFGGAAAPEKETCFICENMEKNRNHLVDSLLNLWGKEEEFRRLFSEQECLCLHHAHLLEDAASRLPKKAAEPFCAEVRRLSQSYLQTVEADVTHFCRMFDYRNKDGDWGNSRDAIERAIAYLTGRLYTGREDGEDKA